MQNVWKRAERLKTKHKHWSVWRRILSGLMTCVVFATTYALILPAITQENTVYCGLEEHIHSDECYEEVLICGIEDEEHEHTEECWERELICGMETHVHTEACWFDTGEPEEEEPAVFQGQAGNVFVTVTAAPGTFPEGTEMLVTPVENEELISAATDAVDGVVTGAEAVDISFRDADGNEIEPLNSIRVVISSASIADANQTESGSAVIVHVDDNGAAEIVEQTDEALLDCTPAEDELVFDADGFSVYVLVYTVDFDLDGCSYSIPGGTWVWMSDMLEELDANFDVSALSDVSFSDDSLIAVEYVEDDETGAFDWRLTSLSPFDTQEILRLSFPDGRVLQAGVTDPTGSGSGISNDLADFLQSIALYVDGEEVQEGDTIDVRDGMLYDLTLSFKEGVGLQFSNTEQLYFQLPTGFVLPSDYSDTLTINLGLDGKVYGNILSYDEATNRLLLDWNTADRKYQRMTDAGNLRFTLHLQGYILPGPVSYPGYFNITANRYDPHNASVTKTGLLDAADMEHQRINYTVKVISDGSTENLLLTDVLGSALSYVTSGGYPAVTWSRESTISSQAAARRVDPTPVGSAVSATEPYIQNAAEGFAITIPETRDGDVLTFTYTADVDYTKIAVSGNASFDEMGNTVQIYGDDDPIDNKSEFHQKEVAYSDLVKDVSGPSKRYTEDGREYQDLSWTITTNSYMMISFRNSDITDEAHVYTGDPESPTLRTDVPLTYIGDGITIKVYEWDANRENKLLRETRTIPWSELSTSPDLDVTQGWTYHVPDDDGIFEYRISYMSRADVTGLRSDALVENTGRSKGGADKVSVLLHPKGNGLGVSKRAVNQTEDEVTWEITVSLNDIAGGFNQQLIVEDVLPYKYINKDPPNESSSDLFKDRYVEGSIEVIGLQPGEDYTVYASQPTGWIGNNKDGRPEHRYPGLSSNSSFLSNESSRNVVYVEFFQDAGRTVQGLQAPDDGGDSREIVIRLRTTINQDLTARAFEKFGYQAIWNGLRHTNDVYANTSHEQAMIVVPGKNLVKAFKSESTSSNGVRRWRFEVYISGKQPGGTVVIDDLFDTELWKLYNTSTIQFRAGNSPHYANSVRTGNRDGYWIIGEYGSTAEIIDGGLRFTIGELPLKADGTTYPFYGVNFFLTPKDEAAWAKIQRQALEQGGIARFTNWAYSEGLSDSDVYTVDLLPEFKPLIKSDPEYSNRPNMVDYTITLNQQREELNGGDPITMEDEFDNLSVDYSTIHIETVPAGREDQVSYDYRGNVGYFTIPDSTKVIITYSATVIPPDTTVWEGEPGSETGNVTVTNIASMLGWSDGGGKQVRVAKDSGATVWRIRVYKYGSNHMESGLESAVFGLYQNKTDANGDPIPELDSNGDPVFDSWNNPVYQKEPIYGVTGRFAGQHIRFATGYVWMLDGMIQSKLTGMTEAQVAALSDSELLEKLLGDYELSDIPTVRRTLLLLPGYADVQLSSSEDGVFLVDNKPYYLKEESVPDGYARDASVEYYAFRFGTEPTYVDGIWQYFNNDILKVRNSPTDGSFKLKKELSGNYSLSAAEKASLRFALVRQNGASWDPVSVDAPDLDQNGNPRLDSGNNPLYVSTTELSYYQLKDGLTVAHIGAGTFRLLEYTDPSGTAVPGNVAQTVSLTKDNIDEDLTEEGGVRYVQFELTQDDVDNGLVHSFVITNSYRQELVTLTAKKSWVDAENMPRVPDGAQVSFSVYVLSGGTLIEPAVQTVVLDGTIDVYSRADTGESAAWTAQFAALPKVDAAGNPISYAVRETAHPNGFDVLYEGGGSYLTLAEGTTPVITNKQETISYEVDKTWSWLSWRGGGNDPPSGVSVELGIYYGLSDAEAFQKYQNGQRPYKSVTLPDGSATPWHAVFDSLPKTDGEGRTLKYILVETVPVAGFSPRYPGGKGYLSLGNDTPTLENAEDSVSIGVTKLWHDMRDDPTEWPNSVAELTFTLYRKRTDTNDPAEVYGIVRLRGSPLGATLYGPDGTTPETRFPVTLTYAGTAGDGYQLTILELPESESVGGSLAPYRFYLTETQPPGMWHAPSYRFMTSGGLTARLTPDKQYAEDGEYIVNQAFGGYELPSTGGAGTAGYSLCGAFLIFAAAILALLRRYRDIS